MRLVGSCLAVKYMTMVKGTILIMSTIIIGTRRDDGERRERV